MKKILTTAILAICLTSSCAAQMSVTDALKLRHSERSYATTPLTDQQIIDVLWAANGISHDEKRTAPSAIDAQDIEMYVCSAKGTFKYVDSDKLQKVTDQDIRPLFKGRNSFVDQAPVTILLISNQENFGTPRPGKENRNLNFGMMDAGIVSENISLYCTAVGLGTVCCAPPMPAAEIQKALKLNDKQIPIIYHPIGYPANPNEYKK